MSKTKEELISLATYIRWEIKLGKFKKDTDIKEMVISLENFYKDLKETHEQNH